MKRSLKFNPFMILSLTAFAFLISLTSCGDDEPDVVTGCTNMAADNYNANATMDDGSCIISGCTDETSDNFNPEANQDDGNCIPARDKFLGTYLGSFQCTGLLADVANADELSFVISEGVTGDNTLSVQLLDSPLAIPFEATAKQDTMQINSMDLGPIPFEVVGIQVNALLDITGTVIMTEPNTRIEGTLTVVGKDVGTGVPLVTETCDIVGVK